MAGRREEAPLDAHFAGRREETPLAAHYLAMDEFAARQSQVVVAPDDNLVAAGAARGGVGGDPAVARGRPVSSLLYQMIISPPPVAVPGEVQALCALAPGGARVRREQLAASRVVAGRAREEAEGARLAREQAAQVAQRAQVAIDTAARADREREEDTELEAQLALEEDAEAERQAYARQMVAAYDVHARQQADDSALAAAVVARKFEEDRVAAESLVSADRRRAVEANAMRATRAIRGPTPPMPTTPLSFASVVPSISSLDELPPVAAGPSSFPLYRILCPNP